ncbi:probable elongation factor 1-delta isoform X4 [Fopius arisanus]|uniref:Probable elongation factor 1-delta isoform X4 n=1 Tax=Fopius arisanus TaxID=64838 RepID=A0A9R1TIG4_9HYME|nr:PREDICTED: probable elongation factor 1-delta isoform X4 [Fopius arisanus]
MPTTALAQEKVWVTKSAYDKAESAHFERLAKVNNIAADVNVSLQDLPARVAKLEKDNHDLRNTVAELRALIEKLDLKVNSAVPEPYIAICPAKPQEVEAPGEDDNEVDLFGSDSEGEDAEAAKIREERLAAYNAKKSKKPALIAKSNIILDIKPWDDETDMGVMQAEVRKIATDGLLWGAAKLVPLAFGISKLQISCVVEDDKVSIDWLTETIQELEEYVQSVDIAAFNKV